MVNGDKQNADEMLHATTSTWQQVDIQSSDRRWMMPLRVAPIHGTPDQRSELAGCSTWNQYQTKGPNTKQWIVLRLRTIVISYRRIQNAKRTIHKSSTATHFGNVRNEHGPTINCRPTFDRPMSKSRTHGDLYYGRKENQNMRVPASPRGIWTARTLLTFYKRWT